MDIDVTNLVTQEQCFKRRQEVQAKNSEQDEKIYQLHGENKALIARLESITKVIGWVSGIGGSLLGGLLLWLITK